VRTKVLFDTFSFKKKYEGRADMDSELVSKIYRQYSKEIYFYLLALSHDPWLAEDILQEVFFKAICSLPDSHTNIRAWLYKVARNTFLNEAKRQSRCSSLEDVPEGKPDLDNPTLSGLLQSERSRILCKGIDQLPENQRKILVLQYFSGLSVKEIASALRLSPENVRVLSHRGRKQLKSYMEENGYEIS